MKGDKMCVSCGGTGAKDFVTMYSITGGNCGNFVLPTCTLKPVKNMPQCEKCRRSKCRDKADGTEHFPDCDMCHGTDCDDGRDCYQEGGKHCVLHEGTMTCCDVKLSEIKARKKYAVREVLDSLYYDRNDENGDDTGFIYVVSTLDGSSVKIIQTDK